MKSGIGEAFLQLQNGVSLGAIVAVNAFGDIVRDGKIIAGARSLKKGPLKLGKNDYFADTMEVMRSFAGRKIMSFATKRNTAIGAIVTNAQLNKEEVNYMADMASNGVALSVRPAFSMLDGDTVFGLATGQVKSDISLLAAYAPQVFSQAIYNAVTNAEPAGGLPSYQSLQK